LVLEGALEDQEALEDLLGRDGAWEDSLTLFFPIVDVEVKSSFS